MVLDAFEEDPSRYRSGQSSHLIRQACRPDHVENTGGERWLRLLHRRRKGQEKEGHRETAPGRRTPDLQGLQGGGSFRERGRGQQALGSALRFRRIYADELRRSLQVTWGSSHAQHVQSNDGRSRRGPITQGDHMRPGVARQPVSRSRTVTRWKFLSDNLSYMCPICFISPTWS